MGVKLAILLNRVPVASIKKLMIKVNNHDLDNVGVISKGNLDYILDMISEAKIQAGIEHKHISLPIKTHKQDETYPVKELKAKNSELCQHF